MTCPSTPAWIAGGMRITTVALSSCEKVLAEMEARVSGQSSLLTKTWQDPHNSGDYALEKPSEKTKEKTTGKTAKESSEKPSEKTTEKMAGKTAKDAVVV